MECSSAMWAWWWRLRQFFMPLLKSEAFLITLSFFPCRCSSGHSGLIRDQRRWRRPSTDGLHSQLHDFRTHFRLLGWPLFTEGYYGVWYYAVGSDDTPWILHESLRMVHRIQSAGRHRRSFLLNNRPNDSFRSLCAWFEIENAGGVLLRNTRWFRFGVSSNTCGVVAQGVWPNLLLILVTLLDRKLRSSLDRGTGHCESPLSLPPSPSFCWCSSKSQNEASQKAQHTWKPHLMSKTWKTSSRTNRSCCPPPASLVLLSSPAPSPGSAPNSCILDLNSSQATKTFNLASKYQQWAIQWCFKVLFPLANSISYKFGIVAMTAGLIGVPLGSGLAQRLRPNYPTCDPLICAFGLITSAPFVYLGLVVAPFSTNWAFFFVFIAEITLNLCWSIVADMLLVSAVVDRVAKLDW